MKTCRFRHGKAPCECQEAVGFAQTCICETTKAFVRCLAPKDKNRWVKKMRVLREESNFTEGFDLGSDDLVILKVFCTCLHHCGAGCCCAAYSVPAFAQGLVNLLLVYSWDLWSLMSWRSTRSCFPFEDPSQLGNTKLRFYIMLRCGVLVDFKNLSPFKDPEAHSYKYATNMLQICNMVFPPRW
jgi:hypothetical protein